MKDYMAYRKCVAICLTCINKMNKLIYLLKRKKRIFCDVKFTSS